MKHGKHCDEEWESKPLHPREECRRDKWLRKGVCPFCYQRIDDKEEELFDELDNRLLFVAAFFIITAILLSLI